MTHTGGCLCGALRYEIRDEPTITVHCHCRMCQRAAGSAFVTWSTFPSEALVYTLGSPQGYRSSAGATREFCGMCGSPLVFRTDDATTIDVTLASLDDPDAFLPGANTWCESRRPWVDGFDFHLPDHDQEFSDDAEDWQDVRLDLGQASG